MALPKYFTDIDTNGSGISDKSVSRASIDIISASATTNPSSVFAEYMTAGPTIMPHGVQVVGGPRHQVAGPVRLEIGERQPLEMREEVVAHVVLDVPRRADENPAHQEAEDAADQADAEQGRAVQRQLRAGHPRGQVVDGVLQHPGRGQRDAGGSDDAGEPEEEVAPIGPDDSRTDAGEVTPNRV